MAIYSYAQISGDIVTMALKIEKQLPLPDGMSTNGIQVDVLYNTALSGAQKTTLDAIMTDATLGTIPVTATTIYTLDDIMDLRASLKLLVTGGVTFSIYPSGPSQYKIIFDSVLTTSQRNTFQSAVGTFLKRIQG